MNQSELKSLVESWPKTNWSPAIARLTPLEATDGSVDALLKWLCSEIARSLKRGFGQRAFEWCYLALHLTSGEAAQAKRLQETLRPSRYTGIALGKLAHVAQRLADCKATHFPGVKVDLASWANFTRLWLVASKEVAKLVQNLRNNRRLIAHLLIQVEQAFLFLDQKPDEPVHHYLSLEEVAAATSFLLASYDQVHGLRVNDFHVHCADDTVSQTVRDLLLEGHSHNKLRDMETSVFRFCYRVTLNAPSDFTIAAPNDHVGMAMSLGYLRTEQRAALRRNDLQSTEMVSFLAFCDEIIESVKGNGNPPLQYYTPPPMSRLQIHMRSDIAAAMSSGLLLADFFFLEDYLQFADSCYELQTSFAELSQLVVTPGLNIFDLFKISRILKFYAVIRIRALQEIRHSKPDTYARSVVGGDTLAAIQEAMLMHGIEESKLTAALKCLTWMSGSNQHLDLQYTPVIQIGDKVAVLYACHLNSNLIRNVMKHSKARLYKGGQIDPVAKSLAAALRVHTQNVEEQFSYRHSNVNGELDVVALVGATLFVFECKYTLLPCSAFEQQTFYDYLDEASHQLDRITKLWEDSSFRNYFSDKVKWKLENITRIRTVIVPSIRLLSGTDHRGHPVRHLHELANFICTGKGRIIYNGEGENNGEREIDFWQGNAFSAGILESYLMPDNCVYQPIWNSAEITTEDFGGNGWRVHEVRYGFSFEEYWDSLDSIASSVPVLAQGAKDPIAESHVEAQLG